MSIVRVLNAVGTALAGAVGAAGAAAPSADPAAVRALLVEIGLMPAETGIDDDAALTRALRRFQARAGLVTDGVAGPRTVHLLARYAGEARDLHDLGLAA